MRSTHDEVDLELVVESSAPVADRIRELVLRDPEGSALPRWAPGAHVDLVLGDGLVRQYSLCGDPAAESQWRVAVLLEEGSRGGGTYVHHELRPGQELRARGPRNHFPLEVAPRYLLIAGGIGVAPLIPMASALAARGATWEMIYGGRSRSAMAYVDELTAQHDGRVRVLPEDESGLLPVRELLEGVDLDTAVYCCGPESLLAAVEEQHAETGRGTLHVERFSPKAPPGRPTSSSFEVVASRSGKTAIVGADTSILDALGAAGVSLLSSCTEGICGTCEVVVLAGEPEHRDSILTEAERAAGQTMFVCVSRSRTPRLVLDV